VAASIAAITDTSAARRDLPERTVYTPDKPGSRARATLTYTVSGPGISTRPRKVHGKRSTTAQWSTTVTPDRKEHRRWPSAPIHIKCGPDGAVSRDGDEVNLYHPPTPSSADLTEMMAFRTRMNRGTDPIHDNASMPRPPAIGQEEQWLRQAALRAGSKQSTREQS